MSKPTIATATLNKSTFMYLFDSERNVLALQIGACDIARSLPQGTRISYVRNEDPESLNYNDKTMLVRKVCKADDYFFDNPFYVDTDDILYLLDEARAA
jgi:hypothetical protein